ncbi:cytochrome b561/ferric reductase [Podospora aff. communis PSN243]|uniref:Cytochrome b561/ferric reductase n=1 Tax=Podospora aff. communis PSN243 TaxID=3040156 RepID=A0AAV9G6T0_9PEZI|nr:cytochrome b561/ferric reductase [Podospora aff. communis PSN243]
MSSNIIFQDLPKVPSLATAHGTSMGLAFVVFFPLGALLVRFINSKHTVWIHAFCQLIGLALTIAGLATGIRMAKIIDRLHNNAHTILGTIVVAALFLQPFIGYFHHRRYIRTQTQSIWGTVHVWYGRALLFLGIINGGLGLQLAKGSPAYSEAGMIVYSVLAGLSGVSLLGLMVYVYVRKGIGAKGDA